MTDIAFSSAHKKEYAGNFPCDCCRLQRGITSSLPRSAVYSHEGTSFYTHLTCLWHLSHQYKRPKRKSKHCSNSLPQGKDLWESSWAPARHIRACYIVDISMLLRKGSHQICTRLLKPQGAELLLVCLMTFRIALRA